MSVKAVGGLVDILKDEYGLVRPVLDAAEDGLESNTFIVTDGKRSRCAAKLYNDTQRAETVVRFQYYLSAAQLPVPAILTTKSGGLTARLGKCTVVLFEFIDGTPIGWGKEFSSLSNALTLNIADIVANMHIVSQSLRAEGKLDHALSVTQLIDRLDNSSCVKLSRDSLALVRQTMIHGDLARENVFLTRSQDSVKAIIDFGDAHYDYITYDIATLLTQVYVTKSWGIDFRGIEKFLTAYNQLNILQPAELETILPLMELRNKGLMQEINQRLVKDGANRTKLKSIRQSLEVKLELLEKHGQRLKNLIINS
jgi:Ser/Thr protein kinase RdoA (MazF antagonist)